jgi:cyclin A
MGGASMPQGCDKYLSMTRINRDQLQLVGISALFIAAKYEEIYPPELYEYATTTDNTYSNEDIMNMESQIIWALNFSISVPSANRFVQWYSRLAELTPT